MLHALLIKYNTSKVKSFHTPAHDLPMFQCFVLLSFFFFKKKKVAMKGSAVDMIVKKKLL